MRAPATPANEPLYEYTLMPTHMRSRFHPAELQAIELNKPFAFTKGCPTMKIPGRGGPHYHGYGTLLFDLVNDPEQMRPLSSRKIEDHMIQLLRAGMAENEAPIEQYERLGL